MTEEKNNEIKEKILKIVRDGSPVQAIDGFAEIAIDYVEMINETVTPMIPLTAPIVAAALAYMLGMTLETLDIKEMSIAGDIEKLLKLTIRAEKVKNK